MDPLPYRPANLVDPDGQALEGLWAGDVTEDPVARRPRRGRVRRWSYAAAGDEHAMVGAAVADVGPVLVAFVWCFDGMMHTWERRGVPALHGRVARTGAETTWFQAGGARITIDGGGGFAVDVPVAAGRLRARIEVDADLPAVLATPTPAGGWNVTRKAAGEAATGTVQVGEREAALAGGAWRDWTSGRQDRHTTWQWAAGAGRAQDGRRVGLNVTTGMNDPAGSDNVVWWDGAPYRLALDTLGPVGDDPRGPWRLTGPEWSLDVETYATRDADENLVVLRSRYVQPVGRFTGTLPSPEGGAVPVTLYGVTEDHEALW